MGKRHSDSKGSRRERRPDVDRQNWDMDWTKPHRKKARARRSGAADRFAWDDWNRSLLERAERRERLRRFEARNRFHAIDPEVQDDEDRLELEPDDEDVA